MVENNSFGYKDSIHYCSEPEDSYTLSKKHFINYYR